MEEAVYVVHGEVVGRPSLPETGGGGDATA